MNDGISLIYYIFNKFIISLFDTFTIAPNVSIGWIIVVIIIMSIMLSNILSVAKSSQSHQIERNNDNG